MKLLIVTQAVDTDDPVLGFFVRWIEELAKHCEQVEVICLRQGAYSLPAHVHVHSLGKEEGVSRLTYVYRFYTYILGLRKEYGSVFIHMNQAYVLLGGLFWKLSGKKTVLWYVHRAKSVSLFLAEKLVDVVATSSPESFRLKSTKALYFGHGIDIDEFAYAPQATIVPRVIRYIGRVTPIKDLDTFIEAARILTARAPGQYIFEIVGNPISERDRAYEKKLREKVCTDGLVELCTFTSAVAHKDLHEVYLASYATVNLSPTGGMDKTVIESFVSGRAAFLCNEAFRGVLGTHADLFLFPFANASALVEKIMAYAKRTDTAHITKEISAHLSSEYAISRLVTNLLEKAFNRATI